MNDLCADIGYKSIRHAGEVVDETAAATGAETGAATVAEVRTAHPQPKPALLQPKDSINDE